MFDNIEDAIANPAKYSINGKQYLLVEFPDHSISQNMKEIFFRLGMAGLTRLLPIRSVTLCWPVTRRNGRLAAERMLHPDHRCLPYRPIWQDCAASFS